MSHSSGRQPLIALGAGSFTSTLVDMFEVPDPKLPFQLSGFAQNVDAARSGERVDDYPIYTLEELPRFAVTHQAICILGEPGAKRTFVGQAEAMGFKFATILHPDGRYARNCEIGEGSIIGHFALTFRDSKIGKHCTILGHSIVADANVLGDYVFLAAGVKLAGEVEVGENTFIGTGVIVTERVKIGRNVIVGAGSVVIKDVPDGAVVAGNPAREIPRKGLFKASSMNE